jgi:hypothetical protein
MHSTYVIQHLAKVYEKINSLNIEVNSNPAIYLFRKDLFDK